MKLLFITGGSRWKVDDEGNWYNDSTFNSHVWDRYIKQCDELSVVLRKDRSIVRKDEALKKFNEVPDVVRKVGLIDIYNPTSNYFKPSIRKSIITNIKSEIDRADAVIIRSLCNIYTNTAIRYCKKTNKKFLVEVTGFELDSLWYHSIKGKIVGPLNELKYKWYMRDVKYAIYVTNEALQKRYPSAGENFGCSDVEIYDHDESILVNRLIKKVHDKCLVLGTAATIGVKWKKQENVIRALYNLKKQGYENFRYEIVGSGSGERLQRVIKQLDMEKYVTIVGLLQHECVKEWLDQIDIYIQPSYMEGLCRSIAEAMGRACPVICSDVGGNYELIPSQYRYPKRDIKQLEKRIVMMMDPKVRKTASEINFEKIAEYTNDTLEMKRDKYLRSFLYD